MNPKLKNLPTSLVVFAALFAAFSLPATASAAGYKQINLVSDVPGMAAKTDSNLVNPWGLLVAPWGDLYVVNNGSGVSTVYKSSGALQEVVSLQPPPGEPSAPSDIAINLTGDFLVTRNGLVRPSLFLYCSENGTVLSGVPQVEPNLARIGIDSSAGATVYTSLALGRTTNNHHLFVADFRLGLIRMFNRSFLYVKSFTDPMMPPGYAPFGMRNIGEQLYVTFAKQLAPDYSTSEAGPGLGYVAVFDLNGNLVRRLTAGGPLNAPWGLALAPRSFGQFGGALLVGNAGDGRISAFNPQTGAFLGQLADRAGVVIEIEGLWGLGFERKGGGEGKKLFFTSGPAGGTHGLLGYLQP